MRNCSVQLHSWSHGRTWVKSCFFQQWHLPKVHPTLPQHHVLLQSWNIKKVQTARKQKCSNSETILAMSGTWVHFQKKFSWFSLVPFVSLYLFRRKWRKLALKRDLSSNLLPYRPDIHQSQHRIFHYFNVQKYKYWGQDTVHSVQKMKPAHHNRDTRQFYLAFESCLLSCSDFVYEGLGTWPSFRCLNMFHTV